MVKNKWVFRYKKDSAGKIKWYKAWLVAKGFTQVHSVDYHNMWASVARLRCIWLILAIASQHGWPINMFNFYSAFLNRMLDSRCWQRSLCGTTLRLCRIGSAMVCLQTIKVMLWTQTGRQEMVWCSMCGSQQHWIQQLWSWPCCILLSQK